MAVLLLIYLNIHRGAAQFLTEQQLFITLIVSDALIIVLDMLMWVLDGKPGFLLREAYYLVTACYYALNPIICMLWYFYADYQIYRSGKHLRKVLVPMLIPSVIVLILSFLSIINQDLMFYIDESNLYHRGRLFYLMAAVSFFYLIYSMTLIIWKRRQIQQKDFFPLSFFMIPPFVGGVIQLLYYGISLIWICVTFSILVIFVNMQNNQLYTDYLTGLFNRRQLDKYLQLKVQNLENGMLAGIMIDLNSFKAINDVYGHQIGDQALQSLAEILRKSFRKNDDFIARYGGDEFVVLTVEKDSADLSESVEILREKVNQFNAQEIFPFKLSLSIGYDFYPGDPAADPAEFLKHIDVLMYQDKQKVNKAGAVQSVDAQCRP